MARAPQAIWRKDYRPPAFVIDRVELRFELEEREPDPAAALLPTVQDGLTGMRFIEAVLQSGRQDGVWTKLRP